MSMKGKKKSALTEIKGIKQPAIINNGKRKKSKSISTQQFIDGICHGNISLLSRAITLIESRHAKHKNLAKQILQGCLPHANNSIRIGITGVPGVGKSTFIETFGSYLTDIGKRVAVLAVDPSSSITKGSILGDKTRMELLARDKNAFIRPSAAGNSLGGVARKTRESIILCEAAGFDIILIETVGVGQSETAVHSMVDFFLLLKLAGAGDELQGMKRGIIEMADAIVINKSDGINKTATKIAKSQFQKALHLFPQKESSWQPKVLTCSALENTNIDLIWKLIEEYVLITRKNGYFNKNRNLQNEYWLYTSINQQLKDEFYEKKFIKTALKQQLSAVFKQQTTPFEAAQQLIGLYKNKKDEI